MEYPVVEMFESVQGEGLYAGTRMFFIRLAGCCVGKPTKIVHGTKDLTQWVQHQCTSWDARTFNCDTDFKMKQKISAEMLASCIPSRMEHVCITGGEPLMHDLTGLFEAVNNLDTEKSIKIHIETSGTRMWEKPTYDNVQFWLTVSPKWGVLPEMIQRADEIKLLIDKDFNKIHLPPEIIEHDLVYIQPVNFLHRIDGRNVKRCVELQKSFPNWRISLQLHKIIHVR